MGQSMQRQPVPLKNSQPIQQRSLAKSAGFLLAVFFIVLMAGVGGWWYSRAAGFFGVLPAVEAALDDPQYQTTAVRRADLARSISGSGKLVAGQTADLGFSVSGVIAELAVRPGDAVSKGQILARLEDITPLELDVQNQALAVQIAEQSLAEVQANPVLALAAVEVEHAAAQIAFDEAVANLRQLGDPRCASVKTLEYYDEWISAKTRADVWENELNNPNTGYGLDYILEKLKPLRKERDQAYINMTYCQGYTQQEIEESQADLQTAQARLEQAEQQAQRLIKSAGVDQQALEIARAALKSARLQQSRDEMVLAGAVIVAPMDGMVMEVNGSAGQAVGTSTLITLADLEQSRLLVTIDETDLPDFAAGCLSSVTFDSLPGQSFTGIVNAVAPELVTSQNMTVAEGWVDLNEKRAANGQLLPPGLAAAVIVTCQQAESALLVPASALYQAQDQPAYVYILDAQGLPEKRMVAVGIQTAASVEILAGLLEGERVITTPIQEE